MARRPVRTGLRAPVVKEIGLHMAVAAFLRRAWPADLPYSHFPAGEKRDARTAGKLKAMGLAPGWPDFIFILPTGQAAFLELKARGGTFSPAQIVFRDQVLACKCGYATARSLDEVQEVLSRWLRHFDRTLSASVIQGRAAA
jgi:elongation factor P hydroxylase